LLAKRLNHLSAQVDNMAYNFEGFKVDLEAMKTFAGLQAAQCVVSTGLYSPLLTRCLRFMAISRLLDAEEIAQAHETRAERE